MLARVQNATLLVASRFAYNVTPTEMCPSTEHVKKQAILLTHPLQMQDAKQLLEVLI